MIDHTKFSFSVFFTLLFCIAFFPNPSSGEITIYSKERNEFLQVSVTDITGKLLFNDIVVMSEGKGELQLPLINGIYHISFVDQYNKQIHRKLVISK